MELRNKIELRDVGFATQCFIPACLEGAAVYTISGIVNLIFAICEIIMIGDPPPACVCCN